MRPSGHTRRASTISSASAGDALVKRRLELRRAREDALDIRLGGARADDPAARAAAQQQIERVGEHRLAGAGLAGEDVQAGAEPELGALDQQQVLDAKLVKHGRGVPGAPTDRATGLMVAARDACGVAPPRVRGPGR